MNPCDSQNYIQSTTVTTSSNKPMREMNYLHSSAPKQISPAVAAGAPERREPLYDLPSLSESTSSLSLSVTEANFHRGTVAQPHEQDPTDTRILRGAEILRMQLQRQQEQLIDQEIQNMGAPLNIPSRARQYQNNDYISDTDEDEDLFDHDPWGLNLNTPRSKDEEKLAQASFSEEGDAAKWAQFSYNHDEINRSRSEQSKKKNPASPDMYIESPPKRAMPATAIPDSPLEDLFAPTTTNPADFLYGFPNPFSQSPASKPPTPRPRSSPPRTFRPSKLSGNSVSSNPYQMKHVASQISAAESDALDMLVSQFPTDKDPEDASTPKEEESLCLIQKDAASTTSPVESNWKSPSSNIVPPFSKAYRVLQKDPAYLHAQQAGTLWQSLVSQHVKFPTKWWNGARSPSMGIGERRLWQYVGRHRVGGDESLNRIVFNRGSPGQILVHLIVRDVFTLAPALDIAIGCFHPNARGVRSTPTFQPSLEDCRDIWLATRRRLPDDLAIENLLRDDQDPTSNQGESPLGPKHAVHNGNMRFIFGDKPPLHTAFVSEITLHEILTDRYSNKEMPPSLVLLQRFLKVR